LKICTSRMHGSRVYASILHTFQGTFRINSRFSFSFLTKSEDFRRFNCSDRTATGTIRPTLELISTEQMFFSDRLRFGPRPLPYCKPGGFASGTTQFNALPRTLPDGIRVFRQHSRGQRTFPNWGQGPLGREKHRRNHEPIRADTHDF